MTKSPLIVSALGGVAAAAMLMTSLPASAQGVDFSGKRIEWIIPYGTGGGSNRWARFYVPWLQKALPGNPIVAVKNMPGASSTPHAANKSGRRELCKRAGLCGSGAPAAISENGSTKTSAFPPATTNWSMAYRVALGNSFG